MTAAFWSPLIVEDDGGFPFTLHEPLVYRSAILNRELLIPAGFRTDFASIPKLLWNVLPPVGKYDKAAVVHDYLYTHNGVTRARADAVLNEAMGVCRVETWRRRVIYAGVRIGGWAPWNRYREAEAPSTAA